MRVVFLVIFLCLLGLSAVAWRIKPRPVEDGRAILTWVSDDNPLRKEQLALFDRLNPAVRLQLDPSNRDMSKIIVQSVGGVGPDLFDCYDGFQLSAYVKSGIAWEVTEELARAGVNVRDECWPTAFPTSIYEGRIYGHPTNAAADALWFHKDLFDKAGLPYPKGPWKWDEFLPIAQKLTIRDEDGDVKQYGFMLFSWELHWRQFVMQWGGRFFTEDGTRCVIDSPEAIAGVQFMHDLTYKYKVMPSPGDEAAMATQGGWGSGTITLFGAKKVAMAMGGRWWLAQLRNREQFPGLNPGVVESPHAARRVFWGYGRSTLINKNSPRRRQALEFLKYEHGEAYNDLINDQADGLGPVKKYAFDSNFLRNPDHPEEDYNDIWRDIMQYAEPDQISPFVNGQVAFRIFNTQLDLLRANEKPVEAALKTAAAQINAEIQRTIAEDPALKARYDALLAASANR